MYINFDGPYQEHIISINYVEPDPPAELRAPHGRDVQEEIRGTLNLKSIISINYIEPDPPAELRAAHGRDVQEEIRGTLNLKSPIFFLQ